MIGFMEYLEEASKKGNGFGCLMLMFTNELKRDFLKMTKQIDVDDLYKPEDGFGRETQPHTTVKYGLHESDHDIIYNTLGHISPIKVKFKKNISLFENKKYDVIKINISSEELRDLNKRVCSIFEFTDTYPTYTPHSTVAYVQPGTGHKYLNLESDLLGREFEVNRLCFSDLNSNKKYKVLK